MTYVYVEGFYIHPGDDVTGLKAAKVLPSAYVNIKDRIGDDVLKSKHMFDVVVVEGDGNKHIFKHQYTSVNSADSALHCILFLFFLLQHSRAVKTTTTAKKRITPTPSQDDAEETTEDEEPAAKKA